MGKRIKADNVEQLMEIVKAIQNGEEPDEAVRKKRAEEEAQAEAQARAALEKREKQARGKRRKKTVAESASTKQIKSEEESAEELSKEPKLQEESKLSKEESEETVYKKLKEDFEDGSEHGSEKDPEVISENDPKTGSVTPRSDWDDLDDDEFDRILDEDNGDGLDFRSFMAALSGVRQKAAPVVKKFNGFMKKISSDRSEETFDSEWMEEESEEQDSGIRDTRQGEEQKMSKGLTEPEKRERPKDPAEPEKQERPKDSAEFTEPEKTVKPKETAASEKFEGQEKTERPEDSEDPEKSDGSGRRKKPKKEKTSKTSTSGHTQKSHHVDQKIQKVKSAGGDALSTLRDSAAALKERLSGKGIRQKELIMLGMGAILLVLVIFLIVNGISASLKEKEKKKNVVADEGLTILVEQEPEQWCSTYPVVLRVGAKGAAVSRVTIEGEDYVPDEKGLIVVNTGSYLLEASVQTDTQTLQAQIEIPMLDAQAPVVTVSKDGTQIQVAAADGRSGVNGIYYAAVKDNAYINLPVYALYTEPLTYESDTTYYFYAKDHAGNISVPVVTTMETANELKVKTEELSLYPGQTGQLSAEAVPAGALLNNLTYESGNPDVAVVDNLGNVTAIDEGTTVVKASADGLEAVSCTVTVSSSRTVTISMIGDCTLGTDAAFDTSTNFDAFYAVNGSGYFFQNVKSILENDDATFANLEGPLTTAADKTTTGQFAFKGDPSYTEILQQGSVDVVTLANNHTNDFGEQGLSDTQSYLDGAGIDYCINDRIAIKEVNGIRTAFIGIYELNEGIQCESRVRSTIAEAQAQDAQIIIVAFHWGEEKATVPDETQRSLAHTAIDCGASLVIGHHPHVLEGIEKYNGRYIVYSLGNFCFGGNSAPSDMDTMIFRQIFTVTQEGVQDYDQIEIIPCSISSAYGYNNYQPTPVEGSEAERIMSRINEYSSEFGQSYTASTGLD